MIDDPAERRLATYGTLAPGRANHSQLDSLRGEWRPGTVRGRLAQEGWGAAMGAPGLILDATQPDIKVQLFQSADLPNHRARLDAFEGEGYRRVPVSVDTAEGPRDAFVYVLAGHVEAGRGASGRQAALDGTEDPSSQIL